MAGNLIDPNLSYAWTSQQAAGSSNLYGQAGLGYGSVSGVTGAQPAFGAAGNTGQNGGLALAGTGLYNMGNANAASLDNTGYSSTFPPVLGQLTANTQPALPAIPASTVAVQNPTGLAALVTLVAGTVSVISVAPYNAAGAGSATFTQVGTTTPATVTVPPGGFIKMTYSVVPTSWIWVTTN